VTKNIYIFSGLGADERVFQYLDFSGHQTTFIQWELPHRNESIEAFASRLLPQITHSKPTLIGLSFGGLIAIEIAKQIETEQVILLASVKTKKEIPLFYRLGGRVRLHKLLPTHLLKGENLFSNMVFGKSQDSDRQLMRSIFSGTNPKFLKWAIHQVVCWKNTTEPENTQHIHGTKDRILPFRRVNCQFEIIGAGHLLTLKNADEISRILRTIIA